MLLPIQGWIVFCSFSYLFSAHGAIPHLQVRIAKKLNTVIVHGMDLQKENVIQKKISNFQGMRSIKFNCKNKENRVAQKKAILLASISSPTGLISWKNNRYKGDLLVSTNRDYKSCDLIYKTNMEDYISTLLSKEMNGKWPLEALKAQAIAARTYALDKVSKNKKSTFFLENSERHQVHGTFFDETVLTRKAAIMTKGLVLKSKNGKLTPAFFHSKCGGRTLRPDQVWLGTVNGYKQVNCPYCHPHGNKNWKRFFSRKKVVDTLLNVLNLKRRNLKEDFRLVPDHFKKNDLRFYLDGQQVIVAKSKLRKELGRSVLPSNNFLLYQSKNNFVLKGKGNGHGVGLCQYGAFEMARQGMTYRQIIGHYYPGLKISKVY